jgi:hypothetical protein
MTVLDFSTFNGEAPKVHPLQLAEGFAQRAVNVRLDRGRAEPYAELLEIGTTLPSTTQTMFLYNDIHWFVSPFSAKFVTAPLSNDPEKYVVYPGADYPRITRNDVAVVTLPFPTVSYRLGVPKPVTTASVIKAGDNPVEPNPLDLETVSYLFTYVDNWGRESVPSGPTASIELYFETQTTELFFPTVPSGNVLFGAQAYIRVYRSNTGSSATDYQFVAQLPIGTASYVDNTESANLSSVILPSIEWDAPPDDDIGLYPDGPLTWIGAMPNSFLAGVTTTELCFSEVNVLHAWPILYRTRIEDIVTAAVVPQGVVILTKDRPYFAYGSGPSSMSITPLNSSQACLSKRSVVTLETAVLYASPDGLCGIEGTQLKILTEALMSKDEWKALNPSSMHAYHYEGKYVCFYDNGTPGGFIFDVRGGKNALVFLDFWCKSGFYYEDTLYLLKTNNQVSKFNEGTLPLPFIWQSRRAKLPEACNFSLLRTTADAYPLDVSITAYYDGELMSTEIYTVVNGKPQYIEAGFLANEWEVTVADKGVLSIQLTTSWSEM